MTLLGIIILLIVVGVVLYLINALIPMDGKIKTILNIVVVLVVVFWVLNALGLLAFLDHPITVRSHTGK